METDRDSESLDTYGVMAADMAITALIDDLASPDGLVRQCARESLVAVGEPAVPLLMDTLRDRRANVRWEAAKALAMIRDPRAASALVKALEDRQAGVRWVATEGLIALNRAALPPLMRALMRHANSVWLRMGAHAVLRVLAKQGWEDEVTLVVAALDGAQPALWVPTAAWGALNALAEAT